jgi:small subunit ribosomal protein S16
LLRIRLSRRGAKKDPHYRVVVSDQKSKRDGRFVEVVGYYNPALRPVRLKLSLDRVQYWLGKGAQPTETVRTLIRRVETEAADSPSPEPVKPAKAADPSEGPVAEAVEASPESSVPQSKEEKSAEEPPSATKAEAQASQED